MIAEIIVIGGLYWFYKDKEGAKPEDSPTEPMNPPPKPLPVEGDDYRVEEVAKGDQSNIYLLQSRRGVLYDDGSGEYTWEDSGYLRGDFPTGFVTASSSVGGTISFEISEVYYENVIVYATQEAAIEADKKEEPSPDAPVKPEEPEEEPPSLPPIKPPTGLPGFGGNYNPFGGAY